VTSTRAKRRAGRSRRLEELTRPVGRSLALTTFLLCVAVTPAFADFIAGADFSHVEYFQRSAGVVYRDGGQVQAEPLDILKNHGLTCVRLRLFTSSAAQAQADPYNYTNNLAYTLPLAIRVKNAGLQFLLDFHYSDTWADPGHQASPAAWSGLTFSQVVQQMHDYTSNCIAAFNTNGAMPDYVQVGNEITGGMLWPHGRVPGTNAAVQWSNLAQLMNAAIQGIHDAAGTNVPKIIIHIDRGGDWNSTRSFFDNVQSHNIPFDIIGESFYPFWHGTLGDLSTCLTNAAKRYNKPVVVAETDFPWQYSTNIYGIPATTNGQVQYVAALAQVVKGVPGGLGAGIFWWGTEYQPVSGANQAGFGDRSFFDGGGNVLPVADAFGQLNAPLVLSASLAGNSLAVTWPLSGAGMSLTLSTNLMVPGGWARVTNTIQSTGTLFTVTVPIDASQTRFYRLQSN
jgi:arabinogalactan endo-1,4-beta-galactosidase